MGKRDYRIGYKKPPKSGQFKKGRSGNPGGRPKGTKNLKTDLAEEMRQLITLRDENGTVTLTKQRALLKRLVVSGLQGNVGATTIILNMVSKLLDDYEPVVDNRPLNAQEQVIFDRLIGQEEVRQADRKSPKKGKTRKSSRPNKLSDKTSAERKKEKSK